MDLERQPLLEGVLSNVEPDAVEESSVTPRESYSPIALWRRAKRQKSPIVKWFLYPIFWLSVWVILARRNFEGILHRSSCRLCRKKSGMVNQLSGSSSDGCQYCALFMDVLAAMAPEIQPELGIFTLKSESCRTRFPLEFSVWNVGAFERARFRILAPRGK
jgi:hypothetical protein